MPQEVHPPQEALFGDTRIFIHAPQFHWHDYGPETMDVDRDARNQIMDLADLLHTFGRRTEAREMELWGRVQETLRTQEVHQLVSGVETSMQEASAQFAQTMYQYVEEEVAKLVDDLAALGTDLQDLQKHQVSGEQLAGSRYRRPGPGGGGQSDADGDCPPPVCGPSCGRCSH